jgi:protoporphyrinogen oxidase
MSVAIVGGGIAGISLGYFLSARGVAVEIFEASPVLGGLAGPLVLPDGTAVDRFYHAILSSDDHLHSLCAELGLSDRLRSKQTRNAFLVDGGIHTMNSAVEFLRFSALTPIERCRLALTILRAQLVRDWRQLEDVDIHDWLRRWSGQGVCSKLWMPMLDAKFDRAHQGVPATWMWSRLVRMKSTRSGADQRESSGYLIGGYATLMQAMADRIRASGGRIHLASPVQEVVIEGNRAVGIRSADRVWPAEAVVSTMQAPVFSRLIPQAPEAYRNMLTSVSYLGVVCPLVVLDRPFLDYWVLNIADRNVPFTGVIETTAYIDPQHVGGHHLVYLPKYTAPGSPWQQMSDEEVKAQTIQALTRINPRFEPRAIRYLMIHRERFVEPLHRIRGVDPIPPVETPVAGLFLVTTAQIYPALTNGESVTRHARDASSLITSRLSAFLSAGSLASAVAS